MRFNSTRVKLPNRTKNVANSGIYKVILRLMQTAFIKRAIDARVCQFTCDLSQTARQRRA
jgi:hypothetical protein